MSCDHNWQFRESLKDIHSFCIVIVPCMVQNSTHSRQESVLALCFVMIQKVFIFGNGISSYHSLVPLTRVTI